MQHLELVENRLLFTVKVPLFLLFIGFLLAYITYLGYEVSFLSKSIQIHISAQAYFIPVTDRWKAMQFVLNMPLVLRDGIW